MTLSPLVLALALLLGAPPGAESHPTPGLEEARALAREGRLQEAEELLRRLSAERPSDSALLVELARVLLGRGDLPGASASLERARDLSADPSILPLLGQVYLLQDRHEEARAALERALAQNARDIGSHYNLGRLLRLQGEAEPALAHLERALALHPDDRMRQRIQSNLGLLYLETRRYDRARGLLEGLLRAEPEHADWILGLSSAHEGLGDTRRALELARQAARLKPDLAEAHRRIGGLLRTLGDASGALAACEKALEMAPEDPAALALLASLHLDSGRAGPALEAARRLVSLDASHAQGHYLLGQALLARGDREAAEREFQTHRELASRRRAFQHTAASLGDD